MCADRNVFPKTREQRCWPIYEETGKTANVLDKLPKRLQATAKEKLHEIWMADSRAHAGQAFDLFLETYEAKYPQACECLRKDRDALLAFYDFPAEHWTICEPPIPSKAPSPPFAYAPSGPREAVAASPA